MLQSLSNDEHQGFLDIDKINNQTDLQKIVHHNQEENPQLTTLKNQQISNSHIEPLNKPQLRIAPRTQKNRRKRSFLPSISKSKIKIDSKPQQKILSAKNDQGQKKSIRINQTLNFKPSKSLQLTKNKQKSLKEELYLPAFIRNFQLPPKKKIQVVPTMDVFKKREAAIKEHLSSPQTIRKYKILSHIGKGSFSIVSQAFDTETNKKMAIKTYVKFDQIEQFKFVNIGKQIENMMILRNHKNVVQIESVIMEKRKIMLIMENCGQQSLAGILRKKRILTEIQAKNFFRQLIQGILYCHQNNVCHRDLKLENILIDEFNCVKIIDFGFSSKTQRLLNSFCGTPPYMAPQIIARKLYEGKTTDIWSAGVILYVMLYGYFPFKSIHEPELFRLIQQGKIQHNQTISQEAKQTINSILKVSPQQRASISQIINSKWLLTQ